MNLKDLILIVALLIIHPPFLSAMPDVNKALSEVEFQSLESENIKLTKYKGKVILLFFGYTNCPDFCPDTLIKMSALFKSLNKYNENKKLQLLFISIDPKDKTEVIKKYVEYFDKDFIGMSMDENNLEQLIKKTGVYAKKVSSDAGMDFYDHTGAIFYVGQNAKVLGIYTPPIVNDLINKDIVRALK